MTPNELRGELVYKRTYSRPLDDGKGSFETWFMTIARVLKHQIWLWERALGRPLNKVEAHEIKALGTLLLSRKSSLSGRTLWLGGTEVAMKREASQFNCSGLILESVSDIVDQIWLLMQGCGVGFLPNVGTLNGFTTHMTVKVLRSTRTSKGGKEENEETFKNGTWTIKVGDSAAAWSKAFGKLLAGKHAAHTLVFDLTEIRPAGERLKGYGWISSGDESIAVALPKIAEILIKQRGKLLSRIDLLDVGNWMGTVLSSRRSAEIAFHRFGDPEWEEFAVAKKDCAEDNPQRYQSNNSLLFHHKPTKLELRGLFEMMLEAGGSEPGFINATSALARAPWFKLLNPCAEILLGNKSFCNLCETNLSAFNGDWKGLEEAVWLIGRANYRQTCVDLRDGVLQDSWHELNEFLRLTGVGMTGIVGWEHADKPTYWQKLRTLAHDSVNSMADELGLPRSKAITTIKPSGTLSKVMGCTEGIHKPLGKYIFNNIVFSNHDPLVSKLEKAGYAVTLHPFDASSCIVKFPVAWDDVKFDAMHGKGTPINTESAIVQLERYKLVMENYVDHNCSITISYSPDEVPQIVEWLHTNWDTYVGVSWLLRTDPTMTAKDLGYAYLPQEVVDKDTWIEYNNSLKDIDFEGTDSYDEIGGTESCVGGVCPTK